MAWQPKGNIKGPKGDTGLTGAQGPQGNPGTAGSTWYSASGAPSGATGIVGDFYIDTATGNYYKKTASSTWTLLGNLTGPAGATGAQGAQGAQGTAGAPGAAGQGVPTGGAAGAVLIKNSTTNFDTSWKTFASLQTAAMTPTGTVSTSGVMMGMGVGNTFTPNASGKVLVTIAGNILNTAAGGAQAALRWGTGTPPANAAAPTGTQVGGVATKGNVGVGGANAPVPFSISAVITGLTLGTPIWFDLILIQSAPTAGAAGVNSAAITVTEIP